MIQEASVPTKWQLMLGAYSRRVFACFAWILLELQGVRECISRLLLDDSREAAWRESVIRF